MRGPGLRRGDDARWLLGFFDPEICARAIAHSKRFTRYDFNGTLITLYPRWTGKRSLEIEWLLQGRGWFLRLAFAGTERDIVVGRFRGCERRATEDLMVMRLLFPGR